MSFVLVANTANNVEEYANTAALQAVNTSGFTDQNLAVIPGDGLFQFSTTAASGDIVPTVGGGFWVRATFPHIVLDSNLDIDGSQIGSVTDITLANGTAALPSLSFQSQANLGLYRAASNVLTVSVAGANTVAFTAAGLDLYAGKVMTVDAVQVVGPRVTGFTAVLGTGNKAGASLNTATITATDGNVQALLAYVKALGDAMTAHGLIGA